MDQQRVSQVQNDHVVEAQKMGNWGKNWGELRMVSGVTQQLTSKMADTCEEDSTLSGLRTLAETLDYTEKSWIDTKETLDRLKIWALVQENRYFHGAYKAFQ